MITAKGITAMAEQAAETGQREWPRLGHVALFALAYYVSGQLGLLFAAPPDFVSALWPPAALTLVAALHLGRGAWLVIWATALLAGSWWSAFPQVGPAHAIAVIAVAAAGSTVRAVLGAHLLRRFGGAVPSLRHTRTAAALVLGAGLLASLASASIGVLALAIAGLVGPHEGTRAWVTWWLADTAGVIIVAPVLLLALEGTPARRRPRSKLERLLLAIALCLLSATALSGVAGPEYTRPIFALLLPLVVWPAFRLGPLDTAVVVLGIAASALAGAALRAGPLAPGEPNAELLLMQVVLIVIATTGLVLAAAGEERRAAMRRLGDTSALLRAVTEGTPDVVFVKDREGRYLSINTAGARYMGRSVLEVVGRTDDDLFGPDMLRQIRTYDRLVLESGEVRTDEYSEPKDGVRRTFLATKGPVRDETGAVNGLFGISRDITDRKLERRLLNGILEGTLDVVSAIDLDFRFVAFNQALAAEYKTGFGVEIREGLKLSDALADHPEALARRLSLLGRAFRGEEARETWALGSDEK
ncbi:MAG TPA: MASE1 domain-containing protein, partial [Vicinamibacteria bacterium]|nr:MASE1 domain-containing protein [Vicinamibacteria bacterium]